jgi:hypothetical protein
MNHEIVLNLRRVPSVPGAFGFRLTVESRVNVRLALPHPDPMRGLLFESVATGETYEGGWWIESVTGFRPLVLEPGASETYRWRVWPCDRAERWPWRWLAHGNGWCAGLPRSGSPFQARFAFEVGRDFFDPGSHAQFQHLANFARSAEADVWEGRVTSNRIQFTRWF